MSDVSGAYELYAAQEADALKIAHHGSSSSTGEAFLDRVRPAIGLLSARQASAKTLERLAQAGVMVYDTEELGRVDADRKKRRNARAGLSAMRGKHGSPRVF